MSDAPPPVNQQQVKSPLLSFTDLAADIAKGSPVAGVLAILGYFLMGQLDDLSADLSKMRETVQAMQVSAAVADADRWTGAEQRQYAREHDLEISRLETRITVLETQQRANEP